MIKFDVFISCHRLSIFVIILIIFFDNKWFLMVSFNGVPQ